MSKQKLNNKQITAAIFGWVSLIGLFCFAGMGTSICILIFLWTDDYLKNPSSEKETTNNDAKKKK